MARDYAEWGWSPLPLPAKEKFPPPSGYTGAQGIVVDFEQAEAWCAPRARAKAGNLNYPPHNVAIRLPRNVIGVDLDAYGEKAGAATLDKAEEEWGRLPATWMATSKRNGSGIRLFRVPEGLAWPESLRVFGGGVDLIRWDHRYVVAPPSIHPSGDTYRWVKPDGEDAEPDEFPAVEDLAELPKEWISGLTEGKRWAEREAADLDAEEVTAWIEARNGGQPCSAMAKTLTRYLREIREAGADGGAHDVARDGAWALIGDASEGHAGLSKALTKLKKAFLVGVKARRGKEEATKEWQRIITVGVQKVAAEGEPDAEDVCAVLATEGSKPKRPIKASTYTYARDDIGNAQRLQYAFAHEVRFSLVHNCWMVYRYGRWQEDKTGEVARIAINVVRDMESEASEIEDVKERAAFMKFIRASGNAGKLKAMQDVARTLKGVTAPAGTFDPNPRLLVCSNGTVELGQKEVRLRPSVLEDYNTLHTGTEYNPEARHPLWDAFLERFQPDKEVRAWLQMLVGYSLIGSNPRRLMVVCMGDSSTGKSTFGMALLKALGDYAGPTNLTIFRDNQEEKPRPDLVRAIPKRIVVAEEASASWYLHTDQVKRVTGGVPLTARRLQANEYTEDVPAFTPWLLTNNPPTMEGADTAVRRRIMVVPWDVVIPQGEEDDTFTERLGAPEVRAAVLAWAIAGWQAYRRDDSALTLPPAGAEAATMRFWSELSEFDQFLSEVAEFGSPAEYCVTSSDLYTVYERWCDTNGTKERDRLTQTAMGHRLRGNYAKVNGRKLPGYEGKFVRAWGGLRLTEAARKLVK